MLQKIRKLQAGRDRERVKEGVAFQDSPAQHNAHIFCPTPTGASFDSDSDSGFLSCTIPRYFSNQ